MNGCLGIGKGQRDCGAHQKTWLHRCKHVSKLIKLYTINMCILLQKMLQLIALTVTVAIRDTNMGILRISVTSYQSHSDGNMWI